MPVKTEPRRPLEFMKRTLLSIFIIAGCLFPLRAEETSYEFDTDYSFVAGGGMHSGDKPVGGVGEQSAFFHGVVSTKIAKDTLLRLGGEWQGLWFSAASTAPVSDRLQSMSAVIGIDTEFHGWLIRVEAHPGVYGDLHGVTGADFNVPIILGASYLSGADLQWIVGMSVNYQRGLPVIPAVGVRWKFADQWVLDLILPRPRLEYELNKNLTLYAGGDVKADTYRVNAGFGDAHGNRTLNNALVDYTEVRVGGGIEWKGTSSLKVDFETGCMVFREFDYHRADLTAKTDGGSVYGQLIVSYHF